jgi:hypothetical protein
MFTPHKDCCIIKYINERRTKMYERAIDASGD